MHSLKSVYILCYRYLVIRMSGCIFIRLSNPWDVRCSFLKKNQSFQKIFINWHLNMLHHARCFHICHLLALFCKDKQFPIINITTCILCFLDTLPVEGQRVTLNACQRGFLRCCENPFSVEVQNCNDFNVFYLSTIPACPGRYCTGNYDRHFSGFFLALVSHIFPNYLAEYVVHISD